MNGSELADPSVGRRVGRNAGWLLIGQLIALTSGLIAVVVISRLLGPADLGRYRIAQAVLAYLLVIVDFGLTQLAVREIARHGTVGVRDFGWPVAYVRLPIGLVVLGLTLSVLGTGTIDPDQALLIGVIAISVVPAALSLAHVLIGTEQISRYATIRAASQIGATAVGVVGVAAVHSVIPMVAAVVLATSASALWSIVAVERRHGSAGSFAGLRIAAHLLELGAPFFVAAIAIQVIFNADALILQVVRGHADVGRYAAAYAIAGYSLVLGGAIVGAAYPRLAAIAHDRPGRHDLLRMVSAVMGGVAFPLALGGTVVASPLMTLLYGPAFAGLGPILAILMTLPLIGYYNMTLGQFLASTDGQRPVMTIAVVAALLNVAMNLGLDGTYGIAGAAVSVAATEIMTGIAYSAWIWRRTGVEVIGAYLTTLPAAVIMAIVVWLASDRLGIHVVGLIALGVALYAGILVFSPTSGIRDLRRSVRWLASA